MYSKYSYQLKNGAIFVADSHYSPKKTIFLEFLEYIESLENKPSQMIFLGDNFDLLVGQVKEHKYKYHKIIKLINELSIDIEIIYFEGNHDFNISNLFPNIKVFPIQKQPLLLKDNNINILASHGDCYSNKSYMFYSKIIRNDFVGRLLTLFNLNFFLINKIEEKLEKKSICGKWDLTKVAKSRIEIFNKMFNPIFGKIDFLIEGHFHQSGKYRFQEIPETTYIATPSLYCTKDIVVYENNSFIKKKFYDI